jgi:hypothetical protein
MHRNGLATTVFRRVRAQVDSEDRASHAEVAEWVGRADLKPARERSAQRLRQCNRPIKGRSPEAP